MLVLVYYFVHYTSDLYYFLDPIKVLLQFLKYTLVSALLFIAGYKMANHKERFTLAFSTLLFIFLFFGSFLDTAVSLNVMKPVAGVDGKAILFFLLLSVLVVLGCRKLPEAVIKKLLTFWAIYCVALLVFDTVSLAGPGRREKKYLSKKEVVNSFKTAEKPPVFFLLFDMYPSDTVLKKYLGYDNTALGSFLRSNGFYVTGNAHSLYSETYYSLASTLSLQPLDYVKDSAIKEYKKKLIALKNTGYSRLPGIFEAAGYEFRNFSVFDLQDKRSPLQFNLNYHLENVLTSTTFFNRFYDGFEPDFFLANRNIDLSFIKRPWSANVKADLAFLQTRFNQLLDSFPQFKGSSFNYFHFMMPHPPVLYDSTGHANAVKDMYAYNGFEKTNANFTGYIKYTNGEIKKMVERIFEKAGKNVVIIIQGDHGYREFYDRFPDAVRLGILDAVYLPGQNYGGFSDSMTSIQSFQLMLKNQFELNAGL